MDVRACVSWRQRTTVSAAPLVRVKANITVKRRIRVPQTVAYAVFDCEFDFDSQEWICSKRQDPKDTTVSSQLNTRLTLETDSVCLACCVPTKSSTVGSV